MSLAAGQRLGPYEILAVIGAGGMGEVYRARDTRLGRDVAIKVLPPSFADDADRRARFEREAQAVAALSHPNVIAIFDTGVHDGQLYVVMELLEGASLRDALSSFSSARGAPPPLAAAPRLADSRVAAAAGARALPVRKAVDVAVQIARGLGAAHGKGLVHRDLKPENVFLLEDGQVKILDFGLARQVAAAEPSGATRTMAATDPGTVMGTVGYMAPEQVRGQAVDARADVFAFGAVLYEMVSGQRAFQRDTAADTMTAILTQDPPELVGSRPDLSPALDRIIRHCLEKNAHERFQSARDIAFALEALSGLTPSGRTPVADAARRPRGALVWIGAAAAMAAAALGGRYLRPVAAPQSTQALSFQQISDTPGVQSQPTLSPDGKSVVYTQSLPDGTSDLYLLRVGSRTPTLLTPNSPGEDSEPAYSPDGEQVAFWSARQGGGIFVMSASGESVRRLTDIGHNPTWSPDGKEIALGAASFRSPLDLGAPSRGMRIANVATGAVRELLNSVYGLQPNWSPHGRRIAVWTSRGDTGQRDILTVAADGAPDAAPVGVTDDAALDWSPVWSPDGRALYFSSNRGGTMNLWRVAIDEASGRSRGAPEPVTTPSNWSGYFSFSRDGSRLAFAALDWRSTLLRAPFDAAREQVTGPPSPILRGSRAIRDHQLSPDQQWVAYMETSDREDLLVARTDGTEYRRLTNDTFRNRAPVWTPDGAALIFYSNRGGDYGIWTIKTDGSGAERLISGYSYVFNIPTLAPNGRQIAAAATTRAEWRIFTRAESGFSAGPLRKAPGADTNFTPMSWSDDGLRLAGVVRRADGSVTAIAVNEIASETFTLLAAPGSFCPVWLPDGRRLIYRDGAGVWLGEPATDRRKQLISVGGYFTGRSLGIARDGTWITYTETGTDGKVWLAIMKQP